MATYEQIQQHRREDMDKVRARFIFNSVEPVSDSGVTLSEAVEQARKDKVDPWVKVGTTTIDGTFHQVREVFGETWDNVEHMRYHLAAGDVWGIGGRSLMIKDRDVFDDVVIISCDIVRRLSECCDYCDRDHLTDAQRERAGECSSCSASIAAKMSSPASVKPTCPECGPHGNRGEVLLASSWAKCTTCAGGKPGDLWGEVKVHEPAASHGALSSAIILKGASSEVAQAGVRAFIGALNRPPSFEAKKLSNLYMAEIDNLRRHLMGPPDGMSCDQYRRIMFGEWVPEPIKIRITES